MIPFLKQVAAHYLETGLEGTCFVFPNRRSAVFFRKYLGDLLREGGADRPMRAPQSLTINDFFYQVQGGEVTDRIRLLLELYESYKAVYPKAEPLDEFIFWGEVILADFGDVDKFLVDAEDLFTDVAGLHVMVSKLVSSIIVFLWNFLGRKLILYPGKRRNGHA